ncbi:MAG: glycosyltransferase family 39 protein, partial [Anaerolineae bacterium]|nr:glycosyltransferase family 39 protein [Anaerolineae bacterium]
MSQMQNTGSENTKALPLQRPLSARWLLITLILLIACLRGAYHLGHDSLWWDESLSHYRATRDIPAILSNQIILEDGINQTVTIDNHPPLYFLILHFTVRLMGDTEFALRFPSLIFAVLCTALLYVWGKRLFGPLAGLLSALMGACSPLYLWYAQEARPYTSVTFWGLLTMVALGRALDLDYRQGVRWWLAYIFSTGAMLYTHYLSFLLLPVHGVIIVLFAARSGRWKQVILTSALVLLVALPVLAYGL